LARSLKTDNFSFLSLTAGQDGIEFLFLRRQELAQQQTADRQRQESREQQLAQAILWDHESAHLGAA
jgi:hypothetical protein